MLHSLSTTYFLRRLIPFLFAATIFSSQHVEAERIIQSTSLNPCMKDSLFTATLFNITFTPDDGMLRIRVNGISSLSGKVTAKLSIIAYGYKAMEKDLNPCGMVGFEGMCPMSTGVITLNSQISVGDAVANAIPGTLARALQIPMLLCLIAQKQKKRHCLPGSGSRRCRQDRSPQR